MLLVGDRDVRARGSRRRAARRSRRPGRAAGGPTARSGRRSRGRRRQPAASRPRTSGRPDGRSGRRGWSCSQPFAVRGRSPGTRRPRSRPRSMVVVPRGDEAGHGEGHRQPVIVESLGRRLRRAASGRSIVMSSPLDGDPRAQGASARRRCRRSGRIPCCAARRRRGSWSCRAPGWRPGRGSGSRRWPPPPRAGPRSMAAQLARSDRQVGQRLAGSSAVGGRRRPAVSSIRAPIRTRKSMAARRVGFTPTPRSVSSASGWIAPATSQKAAAEGSAGTRSSSGGKPRAALQRPGHRSASRTHPPAHAGPRRRATGASARCGRAWQPPRAPSSAPRARRPASRIADLTWALGTRVAKSIARSRRATDDDQRWKGIGSTRAQRLRPSSAAAR